MSDTVAYIKKLGADQSVPFDLLELADPSRERITEYLKTGICYVAGIESQVVGVLLLNKLNEETMEITNIAVKENLHGQGIGKKLVHFAERQSHSEGFRKLMIATGNSSIDQLALYQRFGFEMLEIQKNFFLKNYKEPIFENGIQCKHKIVLEKQLID